MRHQQGMIGISRHIRNLSRCAPGHPVIARLLQHHTGPATIEFLPGEPDAQAVCEQRRAPWLRIRVAHATRRREMRAAVIRPGIERALARLPLCEPGHVLRARSGNGERGTMVRTRIGLPVIVRNAMGDHRAIRRGEFEHCVVPHRAREDRAKHQDRHLPAVERNRDSAAFATVVIGDALAPECVAPIHRPRRGDRPARLLLTGCRCGGDQSFVDPHQEDPALSVHRQRGKALARRIFRNRPGRREGATVVVRSCDVNLRVPLFVAEKPVCDDEISPTIANDLGTGIGPCVQRAWVPGDFRSRTERHAQVRRARYRNRATR